MTGRLLVNGSPVDITFEPMDTLLDVLRAHGFTEVKRGCSSGECGTCIVIVDRQLVNSCQVLAATSLEREVVTTAGLVKDGEAHPIHEAFVDAGAVQCGYCTPGMVMATYALLEKEPDPSEEEIREGLMGNLCRCTGYVKVIDGVKLAAERMADHG